MLQPKPMKIGGFVIRGIELIVLSPEAVEIAKEDGETVYTDAAEAQAAVAAAIRGVCSDMHIPTSMIL